MPNPEQERRKQHRFDLRLKACLIPDADKTRLTLPATTRDISGDGTFIFTTESLAVDTRLAVYVVLPRKEGWQMQSEQIGVTFKGQVVRVEMDGMAVRFNRRWKFGSQISCPTGNTPFDSDLPKSNI